MKKVINIIIGFVLVTAVVLSGLLLFNKFYYTPFWVNGQSMYPTLNGEAKYSNGTLIGEYNSHGEETNIYDVDYGMMDEKDTKKVIDYMYLCPNGFRHKSMAIEGLTLTSLNMGVVKTEEGKVIINSSIRSALEEAIDDLIDTLSCLASYMGGTTETFARYPGWNYNPSSKMRETYAKVL